MKRCLILMLAIACSGNGDDAEVQHRVPVTTQEVRRDSMVETVDVVGRLTPPPGGAVTMTAPADGVVGTLRVQVGQQVAAGTLLLTLEAPELQAQARSARAQAVAAQQDAERQHELLLAGVTSRKQAQAAAATATTASAEADAAEQLLARTNLRAPIGGAVQQINVSPGERVSSGQPMIELVNARVLTIVATVPASVLARLRTGMPATVSVEAARTP